LPPFSAITEPAGWVATRRGSWALKLKVLAPQRCNRQSEGACFVGFYVQWWAPAALAQ
jgi:hypothetical protein